VNSLNLPIPPVTLRERVGCLPADQDSIESYLSFGAACSQVFIRNLPEGWEWSGKRVLDFGVGAGRTLRHFREFADEAEFFGCDIDADSVQWGRLNLAPEFIFVLNTEAPPTSFADDSFDLIYCFSVFSHLSIRWAEWLIELKRILKPGGILLATFMGSGMSERITGESWDEGRVGMSTFKVGQGWDHGGPMVVLSPWWIHEHWGRCLEVVKIIPRNIFEGDLNVGVHDHGLIVARKSDHDRPSASELATADLANPRELAALEYQASHLEEEALELWGLLNWRNDQIRQIEHHFGPVVPFIFELNTTAAKGKPLITHISDSGPEHDLDESRTAKSDRLLADLRIRNDRLSEQAAHETRRAEAAERNVTAITNTKTFRWTRPLRFLIRYLRKI
jgi:SAM-dependent methyltransferase